MRYLILSDIHSNLEALAAVAELAQGRYDRALCCGDLVGYGADPNATVDWVRANCAAAIRGNHDRACAGLEVLEWFKNEASIRSPHSHRGWSMLPIIRSRLREYVRNDSEETYARYLRRAEETAAAGLRR